MDECGSEVDNQINEESEIDNRVDHCENPTPHYWRIKGHLKGNGISIENSKEHDYDVPPQFTNTVSSNQTFCIREVFSLAFIQIIVI